MMTVDEEKFVHFTHSIDDLNDAWRVLKAIKRRERVGGVEAAAFRYALVAYARPYTGSHGVAKYTHCLGTDCVPAKHLDLHFRLVTARKQIHAHSDLTVRDAILYIREVAGKKIASQVRSGIDPLEELKNLDEIIELVEQTLEQMYAESERMEQALPANR